MNFSFTDSGGSLTSTETARKFGMIQRMRLVCLPSRLVLLLAGGGAWGEAAEGEVWARTAPGESGRLDESDGATMSWARADTVAMQHRCESTRMMQLLDRVFR